MSENQFSAPQTASKRLYVGNLPYQAVSKDVEVIFVDAGFQIERIDISTDPMTGRNPSYCFVELASPDEANRAMHELNGKEVMGRPAKININTPKRDKDRSDGARPVLSYDRSWRPQAIPARSVPEEKGNPYVFDRWQRNDASDHFKGPSEEQRRLYVGGLPRIPNQGTVNEEMRALFKDYEIEAVSKLISPHPSTAEKPGSHYYLFVDFPSAEVAAAAAQALDGSPSQWGGTLRVNIAKNNTNRKVDREQYANRNASQSASKDASQSASKDAPQRDFSSNWRSKG